MRRLASLVFLVVVVGALAVLGTGARPSSSAGGYQVRAVFDNAVSAIPGEDVRVAGVKVGTIGSLDVTPEQKAAIVLKITDPGFQDFRSDATCTIRPQSLIGERFVECTPTQPRPEGSAPSFELGLTPASENPQNSSDVAHQHYLPVSHTSTPVDLDLIQNILRLPYRQRLTLIVSELGTGLAARGADLRDVIHRADPALAQTDRVLALLAGQNRTLAQLASDSDTVLAPLARERTRVADFIGQANTTATATAAREAALEQSIRKLPAFLTELRPAMVKLGALADQATPTLTDLSAAAPDINRVVGRLGPFSQAGIPAFRALGAAAQRGIPTVASARPVVADLRASAHALAPVLASVAPLLTSLRDTGGLERVMDYLFYQTAAINGYDSLSHYLRAGLIVNSCATYVVSPTNGCSANFAPGASATPASARGSGSDQSLGRALSVLRGASPASVAGAGQRRVPVSVNRPGPVRGAPRTALPVSSAPASPLPPSAGGGAPPPAGGATPALPPTSPASALLDYLMGR